MRNSASQRAAVQAVHGPAHQGPDGINRAGSLGQQRTGNLTAPGRNFGLALPGGELDDPGHVAQEQVFGSLGKIFLDMVADEQRLRGGQFHLVIAAGIAAFPAGDGLGERAFRFKPARQVIGQKKALAAISRARDSDPALIDDLDDIVPGRVGDAVIDPLSGP